LDKSILKENAIIVRVDYDTFFLMDFSIESYRIKLYHKYLKTNIYLFSNVNLRRNYIIRSRWPVEKRIQADFFKLRYNLALSKKRFQIYMPFASRLREKFSIQDLVVANLIKNRTDLRVFNDLKFLKHFINLTSAALPQFSKTYIYFFAAKKLQRSRVRYLMER
jgi:hypothetical protein